MKIIKLMEGETYRLDNEELDLVKSFLNDNISFPMTIKNNVLKFDDYIIGSININKLSILIYPRIKGLSNNDYFEMQLYNDGMFYEEINGLLSENNSYGLEYNVIDLFLNQCKNLEKRGLLGDFNEEVHVTNRIDGKILIDKIKPLDLLKNKVPVETSVYDFQTVENKIIRLALDKCRVLVKNSRQRKILGLVTSPFKYINVSPSEYIDLINSLKFFHNKYSNKYYPIVIQLAKKILSDITLNMNDNDLYSSAYLINSNNTFEAYCRNILKRNVNSNIEKWKVPQKVAKFSFREKAFYKSYIPDIMINYHDNNVAYAVLDAKNKDIDNLQNMASLPDVYQVTFYCNQLKSRFGGLIYPTNKNLSPIKMYLNDVHKINFYIFTINFSESIKVRNTKFANDVKNMFNID